MKYKVVGKEHTKYEVGQYYLRKEENKVFRIIEDKDLGVAVMDLENSYVCTSFYENVEELERETFLCGMIGLKQKNEIEFEQKFN